MAVKTYLFGIFLDHYNDEGYPEVYMVKKPRAVYRNDTILLKIAFVKQGQVGKKGLAIELGNARLKTNIPFLKVEA